MEYWLLRMKKFLSFSVVLFAASIAFAAKFEILPRVLQADKPSTVKISCDDASLLANPERLAVRCISAEGILSNGNIAGWAKYEDVPFEIKDGKIIASHVFKNQQEHTFVFVSKPQKANEKEKVLGKAKVYSLYPELFALRPFKGEFHLHSKGSDGKNEPIEVAVKCLEKGYDFFALSDHSNYGSSVELCKVLKEFPITMASYRAEEVHLNGNAHVHSFGATQSITNWAKENPEVYKKAVEEKLKSLPAMPEQSKYSLAQTCVAFDKIREFGGVSVFNHPYWKPYDRTTVDSYQRNAIFDNFYCDAIEVFNDFDDTLMTMTKVAKVQGKFGKRINVVGNSDAHHINDIGKSYTIVFAPSASFKDLAAAIRDGKSLGVENSHKQKIIFGDDALVEYAYFLESEYFPRLREIRAKESKALEAALKDEDMDEEFEDSAKKIKDFKSEFWQK